MVNYTRNTMSEAVLVHETKQAHADGVWTLDCGVMEGVEEAVITGGLDGCIKKWISKRNKVHELATFSGHHYGVVSVALDNSGTLVASSALDNKVCMWDAHTCVQKTSITLESVETCNVVFTNDSRYVVVGDRNGKLHLCNSSSTEQLPHSGGAACQALAVSANGKYIASGDHDGEVKMLDYATGQLLYRLKFDTPIRCITFSPDSKLILVGTNSDILKLISLEDRSLICNVVGHTSFVMTCKYANDGRRFVTASADKCVKIWDAATRSCQNTIVHNGQVCAANFLNCSERVLSISGETMKLFWLKDY